MKKLILFLFFVQFGFSQVYDVKSYTYSLNGNDQPRTKGAEWIEITDGWMQKEGATSKTFLNLIYRDETVSRWEMVDDLLTGTVVLEKVNGRYKLTSKYSSKNKDIFFFGSNSYDMELKPIYVGSENILNVDVYNPEEMIKIFQYEMAAFLINPGGAKYSNGKVNYYVLSSPEDESKDVNMNYYDYRSNFHDDVISVEFKSQREGVIALARSTYDDDRITIEIDPSKWQSLSTPEKWYTMYHELGHDILNLEHGQGGRMMFNLSYKNARWLNFMQDKNKMFEYFWKDKRNDRPFPRVKMEVVNEINN